MTGKVEDAFGSVITEGAPCVYAATVGSSAALVIGVVDGFTVSGRVWVRISERAYGSWKTQPRVHVSAERLMILTQSTH